MMERKSVLSGHTPWVGPGLSDPIETRTKPGSQDFGEPGDSVLRAMAKGIEGVRTDTRRLRSRLSSAVCKYVKRCHVEEGSHEFCTPRRAKWRSRVGVLNKWEGDELTEPEIFIERYYVWGGGSAGRNPPANAGDTGSIPGWGRSPGEGNGNPLQYFCLENPTDRGALACLQSMELIRIRNGFTAKQQ